MEEEIVPGNIRFEAFSAYHGWPILVVFICGVLLILYGRSLEDTKQKKDLLLWISLVPAASVIISLTVKILAGRFLWSADLPLHICRFVALVLPLVIYRMNRFWLGVFYFWIFAGTLNANITPDIEANFPHWEYFSYWLLHSFLVIIPLYYIIVLKVDIKLKDIRNAFLMTNAFLALTLIVNFSIGSNYMYSRHKPPVASLLDILGPWPFYLFTGQCLMLLLFFILYIPFILTPRKV